MPISETRTPDDLRSARTSRAPLATAAGSTAVGPGSHLPVSAVQHELVCSVCHARHADDGVLLRCPGEHRPGFLQSCFHAPSALPPGAADAVGLRRFQAWLPVRRPVVETAGQAVVHRSQHLAARLGLSDLWIAFSGYWPERGADLQTGSFKELEAYTVLARQPEDGTPVVVPSVGNTAAAFAAAFSAAGRPCVLVVARSGLHRLALRDRVADCVGLVALDDASYHDCITTAELACSTHGLRAAGGAWNVARRDGLGTVLLAAAERMDGAPEVYVQGIGSGVGAIAAWEAARRLGGRLPRMLLCQNAEDAPVHELYHGGTAVPGMPYADELLNPKPPFELAGGLRDVLADTGGSVLTATSDEAAAARALFADEEGIDIEPAPALALACLVRAVRDGQVARDARVLLNVTGGGRARLRAEHELHAVPVSAAASVTHTAPADLADTVARVAHRVASAAH